MKVILECNELKNLNKAIVSELLINFEAGKKEGSIKFNTGKAEFTVSWRIEE